MPFAIFFSSICPSAKMNTERINENGEYRLDEWLRSKRLGVKESTFIRYRNIIENHIKPDLGKYSISKISTPLMEQFVLQKLENGRKDGKGGLPPKVCLIL